MRIGLFPRGFDVAGKRCGNCGTNFSLVGTVVGVIFEQDGGAVRSIINVSGQPSLCLSVTGVTVISKADYRDIDKYLFACRIGGILIRILRIRDIFIKLAVNCDIFWHHSRICRIRIHFGIVDLSENFSVIFPGILGPDLIAAIIQRDAIRIYPVILDLYRGFRAGQNRGINFLGAAHRSFFKVVIGQGRFPFVGREKLIRGILVWLQPDRNPHNCGFWIDRADIDRNSLPIYRGLFRGCIPERTIAHFDLDSAISFKDRFERVGNDRVGARLADRRSDLLKCGSQLIRIICVVEVTGAGGNPTQSLCRAVAKLGSDGVDLRVRAVPPIIIIVPADINPVFEPCLQQIVPVTGSAAGRAVGQEYDICRAFRFICGGTAIQNVVGCFQRVIVVGAADRFNAVDAVQQGAFPCVADQAAVGGSRPRAIIVGREGYQRDSIVRVGIGHHRVNEETSRILGARETGCAQIISIIVFGYRHGTGAKMIPTA